MIDINFILRIIMFYSKYLLYLLIQQMQQIKQYFLANHLNDTHQTTYVIKPQNSISKILSIFMIYYSHINQISCDFIILLQFDIFLYKTLNFFLSCHDPLILYKVLFVFMILQFDRKQQPTKPVKKRIPWQTQLKQQLYQTNKINVLQKYKLQKSSKLKLPSEVNRACNILKQKIKKRGHIEPIRTEDNISPVHSCYSQYIPVKRCVKYTDQIANTFPYIKHITELGYNSVQIYEQIKNTLISNQSDQLQKDKKKLIKKLFICLEKYLPAIDTVTAIEIYLQVLKKGTGVLQQYHNRYNPNLKYIIFYERIIRMQILFKTSLEKINKSITITLDNKDQINEKTMPKTMKWLFCSVCLIYDCHKHVINETNTKNFQYASPKNLIPKVYHLVKAIKLCNFHQTLVNQGIKSQKAMIDEFDEIQLINSTQKITLCSKQCYLSLNTTQFQKILAFQRYKLISPIVKGLIKMGIQMFSYIPCKIRKLFSQNDKISCALVFTFFFEQYNLYKKLSYKLNENEEQYLMREHSLFEQTKDVVAMRSKQIGKMKKKKNANNYQTKFKHNIIQKGMCFHYFLHQDPQDITCNECSCTQRGFCLPQCLCSQNCPIRRVGCKCKNNDDCRTSKCQCFSENFECEPGICKNCYTGPNETDIKNNCRNDGILKNKKKNIKIGKSLIPGAGLGAFAGEDILKGSIVTTYAGQLIQNAISSMRETFRRDMSFYQFSSYQHPIDARFIGNKSRFINHGNEGQFNLQARHIYFKSNSLIVFIAVKDIAKGSQLLFDYDGSGQLAKNFHQKYPYIKQKKKGRMTEK